VIAALDFVPVISGEQNDPADWAQWTDKAKQDTVIARFKRPLPVEGDANPEHTSVQGAMTSIADQVPLLGERRQRVRNLFEAGASTGLTPRPTRTPAWRRWPTSGSGRRSRLRSGCSP
jgi:hypothetical protein